MTNVLISSPYAESSPAIVCLVFGSFLLIFGLYSRVIKDHYLSEPLLSTIFGILLGPKGLDLLILFPSDWDEGLVEDEAREVLGWFLRGVIGVQVLFAASTLPSRYLLVRENVYTMAILLLPVMTVSWLISSLLIFLIIPTANFSESLIIGACLAPTDPVLANSVVKGIFAERHVPAHVRQVLSAESGLNDGFGTPFLFIPLFTILHGYKAGPAVRDFFLWTVGWNVLFGSALGVGVGYVARKALKLARKHDTIDRESMLVFSVALAIFCLGLGRLLKTNELLACFFAGTALNWTDKIRQEDLYSHFSEGIELAFDTSVFLVIGCLLPWQSWMDHDWLPPARLVAVGIAILALRRLPIVLLMYKVTPLVKTWREAVFCGWFGPIGAGAVYYALIASEELPDDYSPRNKVIPVVTFVVLCSIVVHGTSAPLIMLASAIPKSLTDFSDTKPSNGGLEQESQQGDGEREESSTADLRASTTSLPGSRSRSPSPTSLTPTQQTLTERTPLLRHNTTSTSGSREPSVNRPRFTQRPTALSFSDEATLTRAQVDAVLTSAGPSTPGTANVRGNAYKAMGDHRSLHKRAPQQRDVEAGEEGVGNEPATSRVTVYDEGNHLVIDDGEGNVTVRTIQKPKTPRKERNTRE